MRHSLFSPTLEERLTEYRRRQEELNQFLDEELTPATNEIEPGDPAPKRTRRDVLIAFVAPAFEGGN